MVAMKWQWIMEEYVIMEEILNEEAITIIERNERNDNIMSRKYGNGNKAKTKDEESGIKTISEIIWKKRNEISKGMAK